MKRIYCCLRSALGSCPLAIAAGRHRAAEENRIFAATEETWTTSFAANPPVIHATYETSGGTADWGIIPGGGVHRDDEHNFGIRSERAGHRASAAGVQRFQVVKFAESGRITSLNDLIESHGPNVQRVFP